MKLVLKHEGGYDNNPNDPGGPTKYGISMRFANDYKIARFLGMDQDALTKEDIQKLTVEQAAQIYKKYWWDDNHYDSIQNKKIAIAIFDIGINIGAKRANKYLQMAINKYTSPFIAIDGIIGPKTLESLNKCPEFMCELILKNFANAVSWYYRSIALKNPKLKEFLQGWITRIHDDIS